MSNNLQIKENNFSANFNFRMGQLKFNFTSSGNRKYSSKEQILFQADQTTPKL